MVQTRSASSVEPPATPTTRSSFSGRDTTRKAPATATTTRSRRSTPAADSDTKHPDGKHHPPAAVGTRRRLTSTTSSSSSPSSPASSVSSAPLASSPTSAKSAKSTPAAPAAPAAPTTTKWTYVPDSITLLWLAVSLPLVAWDTGYVLLRPHTMPGGSLHWPLYTPYALYGEVDHIYGAKQWNARNGFTAAQGALNFVETAMYLAYLYIWQVYGTSTMPVAGAGAGASSRRRKGLVGRAAAWATMLAFSSAVMTLSKTVLYWLNEYFSGFDNIGHNDLHSLVFLWIIPNGLWLLFPTYLIYKIGGEIMDVLAGTPSVAVKKEQ